MSQEASAFSKGEREGTDANSLRPFGLCKGEFTVPDDFNDPLPEDELNLWDAPSSIPAKSSATNSQN